MELYPGSMLCCTLYSCEAAKRGRMENPMFSVPPLHGNTIASDQ